MYACGMCCFAHKWWVSQSSSERAVKILSFFEFSVYVVQIVSVLFKVEVGSLSGDRDV